MQDEISAAVVAALKLELHIDHLFGESVREVLLLMDAIAVLRSARVADSLHRICTKWQMERELNSII